MQHKEAKMQTHFNTIKEAHKHVKSVSKGKVSLDRKEVAEVLNISTATLHRYRGQGLITATETEINNITHISYKLDEVAKLLHRKGIKL